jgi:hypothetical protein
MTNYNNLEYWLLEAEGGPQDNPPDGMGNPAGAPGFGNASGVNPSVANPQPQGQDQGQGQDKPPEEDDPSQDPQAPDTDVSDDSEDFEAWRANYFELAIKGDTNEMIDALGQVRDRQLDAQQRRFVEDNMQVVLLRQDANFDKAAKEIRKQISQELDRNNPSVSLMQHIMATLETYPIIQNILIKLAGQGGLKAELHRRMIAALIGAVQMGGGPGSDKPDLIYPAQDYTIDLSTRFQTTWGDMPIGKWTLQEDDPERYLSDPELERLQEGSPEEKRVHRRRVCLESVANKFGKRAFLTHIVDPQDGTVHAFGLDIAECLRSGYKEGKLVVRKRKSKMRDAMIDDNGAIIPLFSYAVYYKNETDDAESPSKEVTFMEQRDGTLYLTATQETLQEVGGGMPGIFYNSVPYQGNPSDLPTLIRCAPSTVEMLMRRC